MTGWEAFETCLLMAILAGTKHAARQPTIGGWWHFVYGGSVWGLDWPEGLWS